MSSLISRRRQWHPTPVLLPGKSHGWRSLVGYSPRGREESDTTERLHFHFSLSCTGEGNGNPLQCSCLENPSDGGTWWAAIYGVAQSRTQLKWLSSSSLISTDTKLILLTPQCTTYWSPGIGWEPPTAQDMYPVRKVPNPESFLGPLWHPSEVSSEAVR